MTGASIRTLRRWGVPWSKILACIVGLHNYEPPGSPYHTVCPRCGRGRET